MLPISGQIPRSFLEPSNAATGKLECTSPSTFLSRHQLQPTTHDFRFGATCRFFQFFKDEAILPAETRVDVRLHVTNVAHIISYVLHSLHRDETSGLPHVHVRLSMGGSSFGQYRSAIVRLMSPTRAADAVSPSESARPRISGSLIAFKRRGETLNQASGQTDGFEAKRGDILKCIRLVLPEIEPRWRSTRRRD